MVSTRKKNEERLSLVHASCILQRQTRITSARSTWCLYAFKRVLRNIAGLHEYQMQLSAVGLLLPSHKTGPVSEHILHPCLETLKPQHPGPFCLRWAGLWLPPSHRARERPGTPAGCGVVQGRPAGHCKKCRHTGTTLGGALRATMAAGHKPPAGRGDERAAPLLPCRGEFFPARQRHSRHSCYSYSLSLTPL